MQNLDSYSKSLLNTAPPFFPCSLGNKAATGVQQEELLWVPSPGLQFRLWSLGCTLTPQLKAHTNQAALEPVVFMPRCPNHLVEQEATKETSLKPETNSDLFYYFKKCFWANHPNGAIVERECG